MQDVESGDPVNRLCAAVPGKVLDGRVESVAWRINPGWSAQGGLVVNQPSNRWLESVRQDPVRVELEGSVERWSHNVRVGRKVHAVILANGRSNPTAWLVRGVQRMRSWASFPP